jgi:hypothetical protein
MAQATGENTLSLRNQTEDARVAAHLRPIVAYGVIPFRQRKDTFVAGMGGRNIQSVTRG